MNIAAVYSHRNAEDILQSPRFSHSYSEFLAVLRRLPTFRASGAKKTSARHVVAPTAMNNWLDQELCIKRDWDFHPLIIEAEPGERSTKSRLQSDYRKSKIEVEVQFSNVARYAYDVYKMAISLSRGIADVGVLVVCTKRFAAITGGNIAYYERAVRELEQSRLTLIVPVVVIGIEPRQWTRFRPESEAPEVTVEQVRAAQRARGKTPTELSAMPKPSD